MSCARAAIDSKATVKTTQRTTERNVIVDKTMSHPRPRAEFGRELVCTMGDRRPGVNLFAPYSYLNVQVIHSNNVTKVSEVNTELPIGQVLDFPAVN